MPKRTTNSPTPRPRTQHAALPYRLSSGGGLEVMLITSRETRRWVIPKGRPMKGLAGCRTASRGAFEEAGLVGRVEPQSIGTYSYGKRPPDGLVVECTVRVYPMAVSRQRRRWPERGEREVRWFAPAEAAAAVREPGLAALIRILPTHLGGGLALQSALVAAEA